MSNEDGGRGRRGSSNDPYTRGNQKANREYQGGIWTGGRAGYDCAALRLLPIGHNNKAVEQQFRTPELLSPLGPVLANVEVPI